MIKLFSRSKKEGILDLLDEVKKSLVEIDLIYTKPEELDWETLSKQISSDAYTQIGKEVYIRHILGPKDLKFKEEKAYAKEISKMDFTSNMVMFVIFSSRATFPSHYHKHQETIYCLEGSYIGNDNEVYTKGETQIIPPKKPHIFRGVTEGMCLVTISNK